MIEPVLPELPEPFKRTPADALDASKGVREFFTAEQVRALQIATWKAAMEYAAKLCDAQEARSNSCYEKATKRDTQTVYASAGTTARWCAASIRQASAAGEQG